MIPSTGMRAADTSADEGLMSTNASPIVLAFPSWLTHAAGTR